MLYLTVYDDDDNNNNNTFNGKYWAIFGTKLSGPREYPNYQIPDYRVTTVLVSLTC